MRAIDAPLAGVARLLAGRGPFVSAHRGFSSEAPENTLPALATALDAGADIAEIDIRMTSDHVLVLMHDARVDRTTDGAGLVSAITLADLKRLDAGSWFAPEFIGTTVPTLAEVLEWSGGRLPLIVELKNFPARDPAFIEKFVEVVQHFDAEEFVIASSFDHVTLRELNRRQPAWPLQMIVPCRLADPIHAATAAGARLASLEPEFVVAGDVAAMRAAGIAVLTTVMSQEHARELSGIGIDFFESDDVAMVRQAIEALDHRQ